MSQNRIKKIEFINDDDNGDDDDDHNDYDNGDGGGDDDLYCTISPHNKACSKVPNKYSSLLVKALT